MTERDRLWEEAGNVDPVDGDKVLRAETLKEQIIGMGMTRTSPEPIRGSCIVAW